jgi:very-short-patch-repair endonuclease
MAVRKPNKGRRPQGSRQIRPSDIGPSARLTELHRTPDNRPGARMTPSPKRELTPAEKEARKLERTKWERHLEGELRMYTPRLVPPFEREYRFHPTRRWRFDFAWPDHKIATEVEGLSQGASRHTTFQGYAEDNVKYNAAALMGWRVLRFTQSQVRSGEARDLIVGAFREQRQVERTSATRLAALETAITALCTEAQRAALHARADEELNREGRP